MLTITSRTLRDVVFDPAGKRVLGRVEIAFRDAHDDQPQQARLRVHLTLPPRSRFTQIEAALLDEGERQLRQRLAACGAGPANIFAPRTHVVMAPQKKAA